MKEIPAVSVIVPLFNAEKYIAECLDSILAQTLKNFEVIVVDDCSTDSSFAIAESYAPKFNGRLTLTKTKKNSGNAGYTARNKGFAFSRGEYVFFADADDFLTKTALKELYTAAKKFDADVVYTGSRYLYTSENREELKHDKFGRTLRANGLVDKPTLTVNDPHKYLNELLVNNNLYWVSWTKFVRRNFLSENGITFLEIASSGDFLWTLEIFCHAKKILRIPNAVYFWRDDSTISTTRKQRPVDTQINFWCSVIVSMTNYLSTLATELEILKDNPKYVYLALLRFFNENFNRIASARLQISSEQIYDILRHNFAEENNSPNLMMPLLFSVIDAQQKTLIQAQQQFEKFNRFTASAQKRIAELENEIRRLKT